MRPARCRREPASGTGSFPVGAMVNGTTVHSAPQNTEHGKYLPQSPASQFSLRDKAPTGSGFHLETCYPQGRWTGCESIHPADPAHAWHEDALPTPALCCLFLGWSINPTGITPAPSHRQTHRSGLLWCSPAHGMRRAAHLRRGQRDGVSWTTSLCRAWLIAWGVRPKITPRFMGFGKKRMQWCL